MRTYTQRRKAVYPLQTSALLILYYDKDMSTKKATFNRTGLKPGLETSSQTRFCVCPGEGQF